VDGESHHDPFHLARFDDAADGGEITLEPSALQRSGRERHLPAGVRDRQANSLAAVIDTQCARHSAGS
jgi:hypothetical protein